jgi:hypothetical protein
MAIMKMIVWLIWTPPLQKVILILKVEHLYHYQQEKAKFYDQVDKKINALEKDHKTTNITTDDLFNDVFQFMMANKKAPEAK